MYGGGTSTYAIHSPAAPSRFYQANNGANSSFIYFGNSYATVVPATPLFTAQGICTNLVSIQNDAPSQYGDSVILKQSLSTTIGKRYRLSFFATGEGDPMDTTIQIIDPGIGGLNITGYNMVYFRIPGNTLPASAARYYFEFLATSSSTTIEFTNWGHIHPFTINAADGTELALDDVIVNECECLPDAGADQTGICAGGTATLTGTPTTGTWSAQSGNPAGATLGGTTSGIATVSFATTASGTYYFIYTDTKRWCRPNRYLCRR